MACDSVEAALLLMIVFTNELEILYSHLKRDRNGFTSEGTGSFEAEGTSVGQWLSEGKKEAAYLAQTLLLQVAFLCQHSCLWSCVIMTRELI